MVSRAAKVASKAVADKSPANRGSSQDKVANRAAVSRNPASNLNVDSSHSLHYPGFKPGFFLDSKPPSPAHLTAPASSSGCHWECGKKTPCFVRYVQEPARPPAHDACRLRHRSGPAPPAAQPIGVVMRLRDEKAPSAPGALPRGPVARPITALPQRHIGGWS